VVVKDTYIMAGWFKAAGTGVGYYLGGPVGALLGFVVGKVVAKRISHLSVNSALAPYYEVLQVSPTAKVQEIKQSYRTMVKQYHPDLHGQVDEKTAILLRKKMAKINESYREIRRARNF
jgi:preprotein translocase subunit Sec63